MKVNRKGLLKELQTVEIGLSPEVTIEQSNCFVFQNGEVMTYNDKVACRTKCSLAITGAVNAQTLLAMVRRSNDDEIEFDVGKGKLSYKGKGKRGYIRMESEVTLPIKDVPIPKRWSAFTKTLQEAVSMVSDCASTSQKAPHMSCINFTNQWVEACDGHQAGRYDVHTPFKVPILIQATVMGKILSMDVSSWGMTKNWVHFKNTNGLVVSALTQKDDYPSDRLTKIFNIKGSPAKLPSGLKELVDRVSVFLNEDSGFSWLFVKITGNQVEITGRGINGLQKERRQIKYKGTPIEFNIAPRLLCGLSSRNNVCTISDKAIKIVKGNFKYVTSLWIPSSEDEE